MKMKITAFSLTMCAILSGCGLTQVTPDRADRTDPTLRFFVFHTSPAWSSPSTERVETRAELRANRCVYVKSPFRVHAVAFDDGGVRHIAISPYGDVRGINIRNQSGDVLALVSPTTPTQTSFGDEPFPNPGITGGVVMVNYGDGPFYNKGSVSGVYELLPGRDVSFRATARNFRNEDVIGAGSTEITDYWVRLAGPDDTPGSPCPFSPRPG